MLTITLLRPSRARMSPAVMSRVLGICIVLLVVLPVAIITFSWNDHAPTIAAGDRAAARVRTRCSNGFGEGREGPSIHRKRCRIPKQPRICRDGNAGRPTRRQMPQVVREDPLPRKPSEKAEEDVRLGSAVITCINAWLKQIGNLLMHPGMAKRTSSNLCIPIETLMLVFLIIPVRVPMSCH